jgi:hypothetical protein
MKALAWLQCMGRLHLLGCICLVLLVSILLQPSCEAFGATLVGHMASLISEPDCCRNNSVAAAV